ncbi:MAG TPA: hypothetical protein P5544_14625 [Candidatus Nanopelagicales bacterium]|nr:hypothetical protein [Candidatus Nanopelagicales bacterium]
MSAHGGVRGTGHEVQRVDALPAKVANSGKANSGKAAPTPTVIIGTEGWGKTQARVSSPRTPCSMRWTATTAPSWQPSRVRDNDSVGWVTGALIRLALWWS